MARNPPVSVLVADDNGLFREALEAVLDGEEQIDVVAVAGDGAEAARLVRELQPDVVLMDLSMPVMDGFDATRTIAEDEPDTTVIVLTGSGDPQDVERARDAGAAGYVTKDRIDDELVATVLSVVRGRPLS